MKRQPLPQPAIPVFTITAEDEDQPTANQGASTNGKSFMPAPTSPNFYENPDTPTIKILQEGSNVPIEIHASVMRAISQSSFKDGEGSIMSLIKVPSNFGSQAQRFEQEAAKKGKKQSIAFRKKKVYQNLSLVFGSTLLGLAIYDFIMTRSFETITITQNWLILVMVF